MGVEVQIERSLLLSANVEEKRCQNYQIQTRSTSKSDSVLFSTSSSDSRLIRFLVGFESCSEDETPWGGAGAGASPPDDGDLIQNALAKEKIIKCAPTGLSNPEESMLTFTLFLSDIQGLQEGLKGPSARVSLPPSFRRAQQLTLCLSFLVALLSRITTVKADTEKLATENLMLDQYIANLSKK